MNVDIKQEKEVTEDEIVEEANTIFKKFGKSPANKSREELYSKLFSEHKEFGQAHPIVLKYICFMNLYHPIAFRRYIKYVKYHPWKTEEDFLESQARYVKMLYKCIYPRAPTNYHNDIYNKVFESLKKEREEFKRQTEEIQTKVKEREERLDKESRNELLQYLINNKDKF